ncbi:MAG: DUF2628 domain-containing protein [Clostridiales bacterium]|nr:DUF2628 domain-containing protein [Clostridiales bacterium]
MDYKGVECPVCKNRFTENDDIVVCPECGTPHHRECWFSVSHCANEDRHAEGFVFEIPARKKLEEVAEQLLNIPEKTEEAESGETPPVISAPILGGMGQMGIDFGENASIADIPINEAAAFVGEGPSSSKLLFKMTLIDKFKSLRFNFVTFLFPYLWFFYRKMYKTGILVIALMLTVTAVFTNANTLNYSFSAANLEMKRIQGEISVEQYNAAILELQEKGTGNSYFYETAPQVLNLVIRFFFAFMANKFYLEHMKKQVMKTREECSSMEEYMAALRRKGGKSVGAAFLSVVIYAACVFTLYAVLGSIYHINIGF